MDITPELGVDRMVKMGGGEVVVDRIHDPLFVKAVVFREGDESVAVLTLDLIWLDPLHMKLIRESISKELDISNVIVGVTHTHGSGRPVFELSLKMVGQAVEAAREAQSKLAPANIGFGRGEIEESYNRRIINEDGTVSMLWNNSERVRTYPVDNEVGVISIRSSVDDSVLATLVNYNAHPVITMNFEKLIVSADYPGAMASKVASRLGGMCMFFLGAAGDINAYDADMLRKVTPEVSFEAVERLAEVLANEVERVSQNIGEFHGDSALDFEVAKLPMALRKNGLDGIKDQLAEVDSFVIGNRIALITIPGEIFVELGMDLQKRSPADGTFLLANTNGYFRYLPTIKAAGEGGYGATSGTMLEVGAGERMIHEAIIMLRHQVGLVKPLD